MASLGAAIQLCKSRASILGMLGAASLMSLAVLSEKAAAFTPVFSFAPNPPQTIPSPANIRVFGYHFATQIDRNLKSVGIYSDTQTDHSVAIWDFTNPTTPSLLWQQQVPKTNQCNLFESFCWFNVTPLPLKANVDYVIATTWGSSEPVPGGLSPSALTLNINQFGLNNSARVTSPPDALPSSFLTDLTPYPPTGTSNSADKGYFTANFSLDTYQAPSQVPAPLPLFGAAAAFGMSRKIRRRITAAS